MASLHAKTEANKNTILQFLKQQGIQDSEIELGVVRMVDTQANEYGDGTRAPHRYIVEQQITVPTARVDHARGYVGAVLSRKMNLDAGTRRTEVSGAIRLERWGLAGKW